MMQFYGHLNYYQNAKPSALIFQELWELLEQL